MTEAEPRGLSDRQLSVLAAIIEQFEDAWDDELPTDIMQFLAQTEDDLILRRALLEELIRVDLEYRWRLFRRAQHDSVDTTAPPPNPYLRPTPLLLEDYAEWLPEIGPLGGLPVDLIVEEYRVRRRWDNQTDERAYANRFPKHAEGLLTALARATRSDSTDDSDPTTRSAARDRTSPAGGAGTWSERYELIDVHGSGGLGRVWRAYDHELDREVALKEIRPGRARDPRVRARFLREARITGRLEHPSIIPVHELRGRSASEPLYYIMRLVQGRTLSETVDAYHKKQDAGIATSIEYRALLGALVSICNAIAFAHARDVIHRDLKGSNVVLGKFGEVLVLDWGLACDTTRPDEVTGPEVPLGEMDLPISAESTIPGEVIGTPAYMAPEQASGQTEKIDQRTDVYGLGAILYEILTGRPPYEGRNTDEVLRKVREEAPKRPRAVVPTTPRALEAVCLKALAREPTDRYPSAAAFADELLRWLADEPVLACPDPPLVLLGRWVRRHKPLAAAAMALLLTATISLATGYVLVRSEKDRADLRSRQARRAVDEMYTQVAEKWLGNQPRMQPLQREFLLKALGFYEEFARERVGAPGVRREVGLAQRRVGDIQSRLGEFRQAEHSYRLAIAMQKALADSEPKNLDVHADLAVSYTNLGFQLAALSRPAEAEAAYRQAIALQEMLVATRDSLEYSTALAQSWGNLGELFRSIGRMRDAEQAFQRALDLHRQLMERNSGDPERPRDLANSFINIGLVLENSNRPDLAEARFREAVGLQERIVAGPTAGPDHRMELANSYNHLGRVIEAVGKVPEAEKALNSGRDLLERLVADYPNVPRYRAELVAILNGLGGLLRDNRKASDSEKIYRRAIEVQERLVDEYPDVPEHAKILGGITSNLALLLAATGRAAEAKQIVQSSLDRMEQLAARFPEVPDYSYVLAIANHNLGNLYTSTGRIALAEQSFQRAVALYEALTTASQDVTLYRRNLAGSLTSLGTLLAQHGKLDEGVRSIRRATEIQERLTSENPKNQEFRLELATTLNNFGIILMDLENFAEAERVYRRSLELRRRLSEEVPKQSNFLSDWAASLNNLGQILIRLRRPAEAEPALRDALELRERLVREHPDVIQYRIDLAGGYGNLGRFQRLTGHLEESLDWFARGIRTSEDVLRREPDRVEVRSVLRNARASRSLALATLGRYNEALTDIDRALEIEGDGPRRAELRLNKATILVNLKDHVRAAAEVDSLSRERRTAPEYYDMACIMSLASAVAHGARTEANRLAEGYASRAVKLLESAHSAGFFAQAGTIDHFLRDSDLDPIRSRADFRASMSDWTFPVNPFAR